MKSFIYALLVGIFLPAVQAQEEAQVDLAKIKHPVKPMLWKIEGKGLKKPSYLFGTIYLSDSRVTNLHPSVQKAFDVSGKFFLENNLSGKNDKEAIKHLTRDDGKPLAELLEKPLAEALDRELKVINPKWGLKLFQDAQVWSLAANLPGMKDRMEKKKTLTYELWKRAVKEEKNAEGLLSVEERLGGLKNLTLDEQKETLRFTLELMKRGREQGVHPYQGAIDAYLLGDIEKLNEDFNKESHLGVKKDPTLTDKFNRITLYDISQKLAQKIEKELAQSDAEICFFAIGGGFCDGEKSVCEFLKKAGYQVTRISK